MQINLGNTRGIKRKVGFDGRLTLPIDFRKELGLAEDDTVRIYLLKKGIYIEKGESCGE